MRSTRHWILALGIATAMAVGCERSVNTVERAQPYGRPEPVADKRIITDPTLNGIAMVVSLRETMEGDLVKIQVELLNDDRKDHQVNYRFSWYDGSGMAVDSPMSLWKPVTILGRQTIPLQAIAPNPRAKDFRLELQESKRD